MRWRVLVWAAALIAGIAALMLGVVAVTAGLAAASGLAGVVAGFCELVAVVLAVAGWAGERRSATAAEDEGISTSASPVGLSGAGRGPGAGDGVSKYAVNVGNGAQGVVIGDGNVQNNDFRRSHRDRTQPEAEESE